MKIYILGIGGTFMAGIASIAKQLGHEVTGSDNPLYPPMSDVIDQLSITIHSSYEAAHIDGSADLYIVGNAIKRGNPEFEVILNRNYRYISGARWLYQEVLRDRHVLAVSGTHGKTTTASMLTWILTYADKNPGYLIGGFANNLSSTAQVGDAPYFVIEADEYDTALFDKRSKFVHYHPRTLIINNIEFDHADIFADLDAIKTQFHHLIRTMPSEGNLIVNGADNNVLSTVELGSWSRLTTLFTNESDWKAVSLTDSWSAFEVVFKEEKVGTVEWSLIGKYNMQNALMALTAATDAGVSPQKAIEALNQFKGVKRRLEVVATKHDATIYDDFAHHPTAIEQTLSALRKQVGDNRIIAVCDLRSYTMREGFHKDSLVNAFTDADETFIFQEKEWGISGLKGKKHITVFHEIDSLYATLNASIKPSDHVVLMSNGSFGGLRTRLTT